MSMTGREVLIRRVTVGWTQQQLADAAGLGRWVVTRLERTGQCSPGSLESVLAALERREREREPLRSLNSSTVRART